jgi:hypothetical protein
LEEKDIINRYDGGKHEENERDALTVLHAAETHLSFLLLGISLGSVRYWMVSWSLVCDSTLTDLNRWKQQGDIRLAPLNGLQYSVWISRGAGLVLSVDTMVIVMPMCRNILRWLRPKARWAPLDESQWFHRQVAYSMLFFTILHTGAHYVK